MRNYYSFACTSIGFSHISSKKPCQDNSTKFQNDVASVIIVSDGHGSSNFTRSERGSKFACDAALESVDQFLDGLDLENLKNESHRDDTVLQLCKNILLRWNIRVDEDARNDPFTEEEVAKVADKYKSLYLSGDAVEHAYGCTLIVVIITNDFCLAIRNGDGQCVTVSKDGVFDTPIPWNENCEYNVTTSLCDFDAIGDFRYYYSADLPAAVFIGSDGVDDSYTSLEELYNLYRYVCLKALNEGTDAVAPYVEALLPVITERGSTDDVSIAGLIDPVQLESARTQIEHVIRQYQLQREAEQRERQKRILERDIKVAEKNKSKALAQLQELKGELRKAQMRHTSFLERLSAIQKEADACEKGLASLSAEEKRLTDIIDGADSDIAKYNAELLALDDEASAANTAEPETSSEVESIADAEHNIDSLSSDSGAVAVDELKDDPAQAAEADPCDQGSVDASE